MGICHFTHTVIVPVRKEPDHRAEMVTQWLFGEWIDKLEMENEWILGQSREDGYKGWYDSRMTFPIDENLMKSVISRKVTHDVISEGLATGKGGSYQIWITMGSLVPVIAGSEAAEFQEWKSGNINLKIRTPGARIRNKGKLAAVEMAEAMLGAPYLWGGRSIMGIDCSGLTQAAMRAQGIQIRRDSSQQAEDGKKVEFENRKPGDLAFFSGKRGGVSHVGILDHDLRIIHSSAQVRKDEFVTVGIKNADSGEITHQLFTIKRYIESEH